MPTFLATFTFDDATFKRTDNNSTQMAVNGSSSHAEDIWDGTGASDTGSDWTRGGDGTEASAAARSGTNGLDTGTRALNDASWFDYGSNRDLEASFDSVSFWMMPKAYPTDSDLKAMWRATSGGSNIGNSVSIEDYVSNMDLDVWQRVTIPLSDFNLDSNAGRFRLKYAGAANQKFYFDDFDMLNSSGAGPYTFEVKPGSGKIWRVDEIRIAIASSDTGWNSTSFADIANGLETGLVIRHRDETLSENLWRIAMKDNMDLFGKLSASDPFAFGDNELMTLFTLAPKVATITLENDKPLQILVKDDLSTLTNMRAYLHYGEE